MVRLAGDSSFYILILLLGSSMMSIRAKYKQKQREEAVAAFNNKEHPVQVLITSKSDLFDGHKSPKGLLDYHPR